MTFSNEEITSPEAIREFDSLGIISPITGKSPERWKWTIDRERGIYFISLGGGFGEIPKVFVLVAKGELIFLEGNSHTTGSPGKGNEEIWWKIHDIKIPSLMLSHAEQIKQWICEALVIYGSYYDDEFFKAVHVDLASPTFI